MKEYIKKIFIVKKILQLKKIYIANKEFSYDRKFFWKNYSYSKIKSLNKLSYDLIRESHSIEKGLSCKNIRPFGKKNISNIYNLIEKYRSLSNKYNFSYNMAISVLRKYVALYENKSWEEDKNYKIAKKIVDSNLDCANINCGSRTMTIDELCYGKNFDYESFINSRHCVRSFSEEIVKDKDLEEVVRALLQTPTACNRQMIKIYNCKSKDNIEYIKNNIQGLGGFELNNISFFILTFDMNSFYFVGERNQGYLNTGLYAMNLANILHSKGIGSCFLQFGSNYKVENKIKMKLGIPSNERISLIMAYGYYKQTTIPYSTRKSIDDIYIKL